MLSTCANVTLQVALLGGVPDPIVRLNESSSAAACSLFQNASFCGNSKVLGFDGWRLLPSGATLRGNAELDALVLTSPDFLALPESTRHHVASEAARLASIPCNPQPDLAGPAQDAPIEGEKNKCKEDAPIVGPDDPQGVTYAPSADDLGCFQTEQGENNCFNYATDILTNTFAQPGRGSGVCGHEDRPCVPNTCADVRRAAESDGLVWVGTTLPTVLPSAGHYVSLHIWPDSNFHWLRQDREMTWSHKPGGSPVRDVDNNGRPITDPAKCDVSPWSEHCGYMLAKPSALTLY